MPDKRPKLLSRIQRCFVKQGLLNNSGYSDGAWCLQTEAAYIAFCDKQQLHTFDRQLDLNNTYLVDLIFSTTESLTASQPYVETGVDIADVEDDEEGDEDEIEPESEATADDADDDDDDGDDEEPEAKPKKVTVKKSLVKKALSGKLKKKKTPIKP